MFYLFIFMLSVFVLKILGFQSNRAVFLGSKRVSISRRLVVRVRSSDLVVVVVVVVSFAWLWLVFRILFFGEEMSSSRKEEERNEKIIRGLMKLPPNRKCINCNSLGPQYVCTNFWTFVCTNCSGIHREFTHRVKSVSMAKFTSQEVEALQRGGNQRAREVFLKDWDLQRQRLPDSSNVDRVREFIKHVYVEKRYAGGRSSDKPPRDMQSLKNHEDDFRRASSYHSYSQSPPYEYQYEERKYGRQGGVLSRKPGSDHGRYEGKISSFMYSPGRSAEKMYEDRFANEGSGPRLSDYSVPSSGDPFRSGTQSPSFQESFGSPPAYPVRNVIVEDTQRQRVSSFLEANPKRDAGDGGHAQRTASLGSFGSFDSNSVSLNSVNSGSLVDLVPESEQSVGSQPERMSSTPLQQPLVSTNAEQLPTSSASSIDLFGLPEASFVHSTDLFKVPETSSAQSIDLFADFTHQNLNTNPLEQKPHQASPTAPLPLEQKSLGVSFSENKGWATFDLPQQKVSVPGMKDVHPASTAPGNSVSPINSAMQWSLLDFTTQEPVPSSHNLWNGGLGKIQVSSDAPSSEHWNAFGDTLGPPTQDSYASLPQKGEPQTTAHNLPSPTGLSLSTKVSEEGMPVHAAERKSINPFDLPYDTHPEPSNAFFDMSALQAALPDSELPPAFVGGMTDPWFPQNTVAPYIPADAQGGLAYMAGEAPNTRLSNIPSQGPVASVGGNPFA